MRYFLDLDDDQMFLESPNDFDAKQQAFEVLKNLPGCPPKFVLYRIDAKTQLSMWNR